MTAEYNLKCRNDELGSYTGDFEMIVDFFLGDHEKTTAMRFKNIEQYEFILITSKWTIRLMILYLLVIFVS